VTLNDDRPQSVVRTGAAARALRAVAALSLSRDAVAVSAVGDEQTETAQLLDRIGAALQEAGVGPVQLESTSLGLRAVVPAREATMAARIVHAVFVESIDAPVLAVRRAS
jgi:aspartokinase